MNQWHVLQQRCARSRGRGPVSTPLRPDHAPVDHSSPLPRCKGTRRRVARSPARAGRPSRRHARLHAPPAAHAVSGTGTPGAGSGRVSDRARGGGGSRGYHFDASKIALPIFKGQIDETRGQLLYKWEHLRARLRARSPEIFHRPRAVKIPDAHPLFRIVPGDIREWERR